jgi:hypothetical protein
MFGLLWMLFFLCSAIELMNNAQPEGCPKPLQVRVAADTGKKDIGKPATSSGLFLVALVSLLTSNCPFLFFFHRLWPYAISW